MFPGLTTTRLAIDPTALIAVVAKLTALVVFTNAGVFVLVALIS